MCSRDVHDVLTHVGTAVLDCFLGCSALGLDATVATDQEDVGPKAEKAPD